MFCDNEINFKQKALLFVGEMVEEGIKLELQDDNNNNINNNNDNGYYELRADWMSCIVHNIFYFYLLIF